MPSEEGSGWLRMVTPVSSITSRTAHSEMVSPEGRAGSKGGVTGAEGAADEDDLSGGSTSTVGDCCCRGCVMTQWLDACTQDGLQATV